jgi:hypothetical protein
LGILQDAFDAAQHLLGHRPGQELKQLVPHLPHARRRELGELHVTDKRNDVKVDVLPVLGDGRALPFLKLRTLDPVLGSLGNRDAGALGRVRARLDLE